MKQLTYLEQLETIRSSWADRWTRQEENALTDCIWMLQQDYELPDHKWAYLDMLINRADYWSGRDNSTVLSTLKGHRKLNKLRALLADMKAE